MGTKSQLIIVEPYDEFEIIYGEVSRIPFLFRATDGRVFYLWPYGLLDQLLNWWLNGVMDVMIIEHKTKKWIGRGDLKKIKM